MSAVAISFWFYTIFVLIIGIWAARSSKSDSKDFFLAGRGLGPWLVGLSGAASCESGWVTLGLVGAAYAGGFVVYWLVLPTMLCFAGIWLVAGPYIQKLADETGSITMTDLLCGATFRKSSGWKIAIRYFAVFISIVMLTLYIAAQLKSSGKMFTGTFGWHYLYGVLGGLLIALAYTLTGGFRAVAWTDGLQALLMVVAMIVMPVVLIGVIGGTDSFFSGASQIDKSIDGYASIWGAPDKTIVTLILWLTIPLGNLGQPHMLVRVLAARDRSALVRGGMISSLWVGLLFFGAITLGIAFRIYTQVEIDGPLLKDKEGVLFAIANNRDLVTGLVGGLLSAAVLAAICSTVDSQLLVAGSNFSSDLMNSEKDSGNEKRSFWVDRGAVVLVSAVAFAVAMMNNESVFKFVLDYGFAGMGACFGPALIYRLILKNKKSSDVAVFSSMIGGLTAVGIWNTTVLRSICYNLGPAVLTAFIFGGLAVVIFELVNPSVSETATKEPEKAS